MVLHPINMGSVSPVPSLHFQVHEPPSSLNLESSEPTHPNPRPGSTGSMGRASKRDTPVEMTNLRSTPRRVFTLSPLRASNRTSPMPDMATDNIVLADDEANKEARPDEVTDDSGIYLSESK